MEELLGSENRSRSAELGRVISATNAIVHDLESAAPSLKRDAALKSVSIANKESGDFDSALLAALCATLKPPASDNVDVAVSALAGEASLAALYSVKAGKEFEDSTILSIIAYTDAKESWTTAVAAVTAQRLLDRQLPGHKRQDFILSNVLQGYLRPLFSKSTTSVTSKGRPVLFRAPPPEAGYNVQKTAWKEAGLHAVAVFNWAVEASEPPTIQRNWPLYVPVIVTLAEDDDGAVRQRGIDILNVFLTKCPVDILRSSGIGTVFQESVFPSLMFLPTLTPELESAALLRSAYRTLLMLALADSDPAAKKRRALLDKILRDGVLAGYFHASQHMRVVEVLMQSAAQVVEKLEIYAVKHLQSLLDLFAPVLTDAFALAYPPAVLAAVQALNATILNCWPRITGTPHAEHIINLISRSWTNIQDTSDRGEEFDSLRLELTKTMTLLAALWKESGETLPTEKLSEVVSKAPHLRPLFAPFQADAAAA